MNYCPNCQVLRGELRSDECENCGFPLTSPPPPTSDIQGAEISEEELPVRYPAVRTLSAVCRFLAFISLGAGVIVAGAGLALKTAGGLTFIFLSILCGIGMFIFLLAISEGFRIFVDIEANTRTTLKYLKEQLSGKKITE